MSTHHKFIMPHTFWDALVQAGVLTREQHTGVRRVVIDAEQGRPVMMYLEQIADERLLAVTIGLKGIEVHTSGNNPGRGEKGERGVEAEGKGSAGSPDDQGQHEHSSPGNDGFNGI